MIRIINFMLVISSVFGAKFSCNHESAVNTFKKPTYDFSVQLLDRVAQETGYHFVFSPLSTWLQLITLAEGAKGPTKNEIWKVTRYDPRKCLRRKYREVLNGIDEEMAYMSKRRNVIVINKLLAVKKSFKNEVKRMNNTIILSLYFNDPENSAAKTNEIIKMSMDEVIKEGLDAENFNFSMLLMIEAAYFKSDWQKAFNPVYTSKETFYSEENVAVDKVRMMTQIGYFNITYVPAIGAKVLELPFNTDSRISMMIFLPTKGSVKNLLFHIRKIRLRTIFMLFKKHGEKLLSVKLPRFKINTDVVNLPELIWDMGVKRIFSPILADFSGISDYKMYTSFMNQVADIEVTENGATARAMAEFLIAGSTDDFVVNKPFAYLIADRKADVILFGGIYSNPSIY